MLAKRLMSALRVRVALPSPHRKTHGIPCLWDIVSAAGA